MELEIPTGRSATLAIGAKKIALTNLDKVFWPELGLTKRDLLQYYARVSAVLIPHLKDRAMVMKRYPNGIHGQFFFMKRAPAHRPAWLKTCSIEHASKSVIAFPMVQDSAALLWIVNLGCIDLNPWYARCDDTDLPDYLHFDLDPVPDAGFQSVLETALHVREVLVKLKLKSYVKTTGSSGVHIYVPIRRGPTQKQVWTVAKRLAKEMEASKPSLITAEYRIAKRPPGRVLVDYNQNAWGRTLASVYSVRPRPEATVAAPVSWEEVERGFRLEDFRMDNVSERIQRLGDLFAPTIAATGRCRLEPLL